MNKSLGMLLYGVDLIIIFLLLYIDFFAHDTSNAIILVLVGVLAVSTIISAYADRDEPQKRIGFFSLVTTIVIFLLMLIFERAGGVSEIGLSLENPIVWAVFLISLWMSYKKIKAV